MLTVAYILTFLAGLNQASAFTISNLKLTTNPSYGSANGSYYVSNVTGRQVLDLHFYLKKDINSKIMVTFELYKFNGQKKLKLLTLPKVNLCDLMRSAISAPVILDFVKESDGNLFGVCPYKVGHYYLNQYPMQRSSERRFLPRGSYYFMVEILHEDGKKESVYKLEVHASRDILGTSRLIQRAKKLVFTVKKITSKAMVAMTYYRPELLGVGCVMQYAGIQYPDIARMLTPENSIKFVFQILRSIRDYANDFQKSQSGDTENNNIAQKLQQMTKDEYASYVQYPPYSPQQWKRKDQFDALQLNQLMAKTMNQGTEKPDFDPGLIKFIESLPDHDPLQSTLPKVEVHAGKEFEMPTTTTVTSVQIDEVSKPKTAENIIATHIDSVIQRDLNPWQAMPSIVTPQPTLSRRKRFLLPKPEKKPWYKEGPLNDYQIIQKVKALEDKLNGESFSVVNPQKDEIYPYPSYSIHKIAEKRVQNNDKLGPVYTSYTKPSSVNLPAVAYGIPADYGPTKPSADYGIPNLNLPQTVYAPYENQQQEQGYDIGVYPASQLDVADLSNVNLDNDYVVPVPTRPPPSPGGQESSDTETWDMKVEKFILTNFVTPAEDKPPTLWKCAQVYAWENIMRIFTTNFL